MTNLRFSLRDILWLVVVVALLFAWWHERRVRQRAELQVESAELNLMRETQRSAQLDMSNRMLTEFVNKVKMGFRPP